MSRQMHTLLLVLAISAWAIGATASPIHKTTSSISQSASEWKRRVIYQVLTDRFAKSTSRFHHDNGTQRVDDTPCQDLSNYCGGTWNGLAAHLDYISTFGASAVWISPIPDNTEGGYHGYWARDLTKINSNFGTEQDLLSLVQKMHGKGLWAMVDVVANHMGNQPTPNRSDFSSFYPFNSSVHYHDYCEIQDWNDQHQVEFCRLANLPDLKQENNFVASYLCQWINSTVEKYGFDGIRIDTVREVPSWFWSQYSKCAGTYNVGEVDDWDVDVVAPYQGPLEATLNYPLYGALRQAFQEQQSMTVISQVLKDEAAAFKDTSVLANFLDNHDNPRFLNINKDWNTLKSALAYLVFAEGIPVIYYGTEQGFTGGNDPDNREDMWRSSYSQDFDLFKYTGFLLNFRKQLPDQFFDQQQIERYVDDTFYAYSRMWVFVATTNGGTGAQQTRTIQYHPYSEGTVLIDILNNDYTTAVKNGQFDVTITQGLPVIFVPKNNFLSIVRQIPPQFL